MVGWHIPSSRETDRQTALPYSREARDKRPHPAFSDIPHIPPADIPAYVLKIVRS